MTLPLREKRKQETALLIQRATLELAKDKDLEGVTTEEIAVASGISTRTFFNYYPNKETAAAGLPPKFTQEQKDALRVGEAPIAAEIKQILDQHMEALAAQEDILRLLGRILKSNAKARGILESHLADERQEITTALIDRVGNRHIAAALAISVSSAIGGAIMLWEREEALTLGAALDVIWEGMIDSSRLLVTSTER